MIMTGWGGATDAGRVRPANEDRYFAGHPVFVVADGMGGHAAGEVASQAAVDAFASLAGEGARASGDAAAAIDLANTTILDTAAEHPEMLGMGTTVAGLVVINTAGVDHWQVLNIGDSRVYRFSDGAMTLLTRDHSEVEEMVGAGRLTREDARHYARRNVVTRSLGTDPAPQADFWVFPPAAPERFLICSDGLTNELDEAEIEQVLAVEPDPQAAADTLVRMAIDAGGRDNITALVVDGRVEESEIDEDTNPRETVLA